MKRIALLIGCSEYPQLVGAPNLLCVNDDLKAIAVALTSSGYEVRMPPPTGANDRTKISEWLRPQLELCPKKAVVIIYFTGHGFATSPRGMYWVLSSFRGDLSFDDLPTYGIFQDELEDWIHQKCKSKLVISISDACRETVKPVQSVGYVRSRKSDEKLAWLFACSRGEYARYCDVAPHVSHFTEALATHVDARHPSMTLDNVKSTIQRTLDQVVSRARHRTQNFWISPPTSGGRPQYDPMSWTIFSYNGHPATFARPAPPPANVANLSTHVVIADKLGNELDIALPARAGPPRRIASRFGSILKRLAAILGGIHE